MTEQQPTAEPTTDAHAAASRLPSPPSPPGRAFRGVGIILAVLCVIVAGIAVRFTDDLTFEVIKTVDLGETTSLNGGRVTVTNVEAGQILQVGSYDADRIETTGMFLAVTVRLEAPREEEKVGGLGGLNLYAGDRTYASFGTNTSISAPAGYVGTGRVLFEVDPDHIAGAEVELAEHEMVYQVPEKVRVRLGITESNAEEWARSAQGRALDAGQGVEMEVIP